MKNINEKIIAIIASAQNENGSFTSLLSQNKNEWRNAKNYSIVFPNALILNCIKAEKDNPQIKKISSRLCDFLLSQVSEDATVNYTERQTPPPIREYPDDLDDTCCTWGAISEFKAEEVTPEIMAKLVKVLTITESQPGGPYRTWIVDNNAPVYFQDIDPIVNTNIAWFLGIHGIKLQPLNTYLKNEAKNEIITSQYYESFYLAAYFMSRGLYKKDRAILKKAIKKSLASPHWPLSTFELSCAITALINCNGSYGELEPLIQKLEKNINNNNFMPFSCYKDVGSNGEILYVGSSALTAALALEAWNQITILKTKKTTKNKYENNVLSDIKTRLAKASPLIHEKAQPYLKEIDKSGFTEYITMLPSLFNASLKKPISDDTKISTLNKAATFGWLAYTIFDNIWDNEGSKNDLGVATVSLRESTQLLYLINDNATWQNQILSLADKIDAAFTWEVSYCHFQTNAQIKSISVPHYEEIEKNYVERSIALAAAPLAILSLLNIKPHSTEWTAIYEFFYHYIAMRQLNDDAHDWKADLKAGRLNLANIRIISVLKNDSKLKKLSFSEIKSKKSVEKLFWESILDSIVFDVKNHAAIATKKLTHLQNLLKSDTMFTTILNAQLSIAQKAINERDATLSFINSYTK